MCKRLTWHATLIFLIGLLPSAVAHDHVTPPNPVQGDKPRQEKHALAIGATLDSQGRLWLAKVVSRQVQVSHSDDGGKSFSNPVAVTSSPENISADGENRPKIAVAQDGTVLLSWTQTLPQAYSGNIRFSRSVDGGKTFSIPITLNDDSRITSHRFDTLTIDGKGRVAVAWLDARDRDAANEKSSARDRDAAKGKPNTYAGTSIYYTQSNDNGAHFQTNRRLNEHNCECCRVASTWTKDGPAVFWRNLYGTNIRDFAVAGLDGGIVRRATDDDWHIDACPHHGGGIAAGGQSALHLVWFTQGKTRQGLFYKRMVGESGFEPMPFGNAAAQAGHPAVAVAGNLVVLTWREFDGNAYVAQAMRSDDGGKNWGAPRRLAETAGMADYPLPVSDGRRVLVLWNTTVNGLHVFQIDPAAQINASVSINTSVQP